MCVRPNGKGFLFFFFYKLTLLHSESTQNETKQQQKKRRSDPEKISFFFSLIFEANHQATVLSQPAWTVSAITEIQVIQHEKDFTTEEKSKEIT